MTDFLPPIGFWSYTSSDDTAARGRLSQLRRLLADELQLKIGKTPEVKIFQDVAMIDHGADWSDAIHVALSKTSFFIPIVTPAFLQSEWCCREVLHFQERERTLGHNNLIFPLHYVDTDKIDMRRPGTCHDPKALEALKRHQWIDFRKLRVEDPNARDVSKLLDSFTDSIYNALNGGGTAIGTSTLISQQPPAQPTPPRGPQPGDIARDGPDYPEMVLIPAGTYLRGVPEAEQKREGGADNDARPIRSVTIPAPFWLGRFPVTRGEFAAFVNNTGYKAGDKAYTTEPDAKGNLTWEERSGRGWFNPGFPQTDRDPVVCVNHDDAMAYIEWLNDKTKGGYRLPSEAEWEYAARARTKTARYWGDGRDNANLYANVADRSLMTRLKAKFDPERFFDCDDGYVFTAPVGSFKANDFGLYDMLGNVWEWCADNWHDSYNGAPDDGSAWITGGDSGRCVLRGGSWGNFPRNVRAGVRFINDRGLRDDDAGFRLSRTLSAPIS